jgi:hypothetical protein
MLMEEYFPQPTDRGKKKLTLSISVSWKALSIITLLVAVGIIGFLSFHAYKQQRDVGEFKKVQQLTPFPVYYPAKLPSSFQTDNTSILYGERVVTFSIMFKKEKALAVSEQSIPAKFDFKQFYKVNVEQPLHADIPQGQLTTGKFNGLPVCMLITPKTWVLISDPTSTHAGQLQAICRGLKVV